MLIHCTVSTPENWTRAVLSVILSSLSARYSLLRNQDVIVSSHAHFSSQNSVNRSNECRELKKDDYRVSPVCFPTPFLMLKIQWHSERCLSRRTRGVRSDAHYCSVRLHHQGRALLGGNVTDLMVKNDSSFANITKSSSHTGSFIEWVSFID